jgi:small GTP-binding protein
MHVSQATLVLVIWLACLSSLTVQLQHYHTRHLAPSRTRNFERYAAVQSRSLASIVEKLTVNSENAVGLATVRPGSDEIGIKARQGEKQPKKTSLSDAVAKLKESANVEPVIVKLTNRALKSEAKPQLSLGQVIQKAAMQQQNISSSAAVLAPVAPRSKSQSTERKTVRSRSMNDFISFPDKGPPPPPKSYDLKSLIHPHIGKDHEQWVSSNTPMKVLMLENPCVLARYRVDRSVSQLKQQLLGLQSEWQSSRSHSSQSTRDTDLFSPGHGDHSVNRPAGTSSRRGYHRSTSASSVSDDEYAMKRMGIGSRLARKYGGTSSAVKQTNEVVVKTLVLPATGSIDITELAEVVDIRSDKISKFITEQLGVIVREDHLIDVTIAKDVLIWLRDENKIPLNIVVLGDDDGLDNFDGSGTNGSNNENAFEPAAIPASQSDQSSPSVESAPSSPPLVVASEKNSPKKSRVSIQSKLRSSDSVRRDPVVSIMGHVDHGKTTLLDQIRCADVAKSEAGGITQRVSAFSVRLPASTSGLSEDRTITFVDTPGHSVFHQMRARGANVTDIAVLVIAANDGIKEQTVECIQAAKASGCAIIVAINKVWLLNEVRLNCLVMRCAQIDLPTSNVKQILIDLMKYDIVTEDFGGDVQFALVSGLTGVGVPQLLEKIILEVWRHACAIRPLLTILAYAQSDVMELSAPKDAEVSGTVLDGSIDKKHGITGTLLVQQGNLKVGNIIVAGTTYGKVKRMLNDRGDIIRMAGPSEPVRVSLDEINSTMMLCYR